MHTISDTHATHAARTSLLPPPMPVEDDRTPLPSLMMKQIFNADSKHHALLVRRVWRLRAEAYRIDNECSLPSMVHGRMVAVDKTCPGYRIAVVLADRLITVTNTLSVLVFDEGDEPFLVRLPLEVTT